MWVHTRSIIFSPNKPCGLNSRNTNANTYANQISMPPPSIEIWFAYVLALVFLLFRPQGLFGEKIGRAHV